MPEKITTFRPLSISFLLITGDRSTIFPVIFKEKNIKLFFQTRNFLFSHNSQYGTWQKLLVNNTILDTLPCRLIRCIWSPALASVLDYKSTGLWFRNQILCHRFKYTINSFISCFFLVFVFPVTVALCIKKQNCFIWLEEILFSLWALLSCYLVDCITHTKITHFLLDVCLSHPISDG